MLIPHRDAARRLPSRRHLLCLLLAGAATPGAAHAAPDAGPEAPIAALYQALAGVMHAGMEVPFRQRYHQLALAIDASFDLGAILRSSVGPRWTAMDAPTRGALQVAFRRFTVATYVASFDQDDGERFELIPGTRPVGADQVVQSRIVPAKGDPTRLDYVMRQTGPGWRAVDVLLDGTISRVAVQRSDFRTLLAGGNASALIASLQRKADELSGGAALGS